MSRGRSLAPTPVLEFTSLDTRVQGRDPPDPRKTKTMFVEIAVNLPPVRGTFDYHLPPELRQVVQPGHLVTAPFGDRQVQGVVIRRMNQAAVEETRPIDDLLDEEPVLTGAQLTLATEDQCHREKQKGKSRFD